MHLFKRMVECGVVNAIWSLKMTEEKAKDRKRLYEGHLKHSRMWHYNPMTWHQWKFWFWPGHEDDPDIILKAAKKQNAVELFGRKIND
jgi:hypothetical protein